VFTGIIEGLGTVEAISPRGAAYRLAIELGDLCEGVKLGDSVAISGTCLTVVSLHGARAEFDVIRETVERTSFASLKVKDTVNVERSMKVGDRFHGHIVSGHVDGAGKVTVHRSEPGQTVLSVAAAPELTRFIVEKGSVTLDGVSLTVTAADERSFSVALIPMTLEVTTLGTKTVGSLINVEVDPIGKWVHRLLSAYVPGGGVSAAKILSLDDLRRSGFA
jgi:riboflavin synthase